MHINTPPTGTDTVLALEQLALCGGIYIYRERERERLSPESGGQMANQENLGRRYA